MSDTPVLETRGLGRRFGGLDAVKDVSLSIPAGQTLGIIGPNGAGKSTFVNLVTGHLRPSSGRILIDGKDLTRARPWTIAHARVARTFQIVKPFRGLTVRENVAIGALYGTGGATVTRHALRTADEVLERVGLTEQASRSPGELTVADARRLELAKALALKPRLLLLDEVMAGLRPTEIDQMVRAFADLTRETGISILLTEHVMRAVMALSHHIVVLHHGQKICEGSPEEVARDPRVLESYLGSAGPRAAAASC